jgi:hypothetical protein
MAIDALSGGLLWRVNESKAKKRRVATGLVVPPKEAPKTEVAAHASLGPEDKAIISCIFKQPVRSSDLYHSTARPYVTATAMMGKHARLAMRPLHLTPGHFCTAGGIHWDPVAWWTPTSGFAGCGQA